LKAIAVALLAFRIAALSIKGDGIARRPRRLIDEVRIDQFGARVVVQG
jgi:hypothetical protein